MNINSIYYYLCSVQIIPANKSVKAMELATFQRYTTEKMKVIAKHLGIKLPGSKNEK